MHNAAFSALDLNGVYVPMKIHDVKTALIGLKELGFIGISITIPHKENIFEFLDVIDPVALRIGAVNTLLLKEDTVDTRQVLVHGFNTDWIGAKIALEEQISLPDRTALIVGAGGAAKAVGYGLLEAGAEVVIVNRTEKSGLELANSLGCKIVPFSRLSSIQADLLVNTTSVGMTPNINDIVVPPEFLKRFEVVMDIVYAPLQTRMLKEAAKVGCKIVDGLGMLLYQGAAQFEIWTGMRPPLDIMRQALENELKSREK
jgi:shikimate dehydrogenase